MRTKNTGTLTVYKMGAYTTRLQLLPIDYKQINECLNTGYQEMVLRTIKMRENYYFNAMNYSFFYYFHINHLTEKIIHTIAFDSCKALDRMKNSPVGQLTLITH